MPKEYFKVENARSLNDLAKGARIHVIGVAGVAMAQMAIELASRGFEVSGSDKEFYEPMGSLLGRSPVRLCRGYDATNIPKDVALVVIGNAVSYEHPEVQEVERAGYPYTLFPKLLFELVIQGKHSIVASGTHGKSTTSALCATVLERLGTDPGYFIGGVVRDLPHSLKCGSGSFSVVEGDEYDSSFFAKVPKFSFYRPNTLIVTSIEYDHADIYPSLDAINAQFNGLVSSLGADDTAIVCTDTENVRTLLAAWRKSSRCTFVTYGNTGDADYSITGVETVDGVQRVAVRGPNGTALSFDLTIPGRHNATNALAVYLTCTRRGLEASRVAQALREFQGVKRRQEIRYSKNDLIVIDDFAHHPTAVRETIDAVKKRYPRSRLWAVFEPRSNTSRRKVFQEGYISAFKEADRVVLCDVQARSIDPLDQLIEVRELSEQIGKTGVASEMLTNAEQIRAQLAKELKSGDVALIMSNGSFGGLVDNLVRDLEAR